MVRVKICGLTRVDEAVACARLGARWIGINFHPDSPRSVQPEAAAEIVAALPASAAGVGVFIDRPALQVAQIAARVGLTIVQLHGQEPPETLTELAHLQVIKAFRLEHADSWIKVNQYLDRAGALGRPPDAVLIDGYHPGKQGGTGVTIADELLDRMPTMPRLILAGGLTPENVAARIARARPWMVDVASGVETAPGRKDLARVASFITAAHSVAHAHLD